MIVKIERADGGIETFETPNYLLSKAKDFHLMIVGVTIYDNGKKVASRKRAFKFLYKKITFKSKKVQEFLKKENEEFQKAQANRQNTAEK